MAYNVIPLGNCLLSGCAFLSRWRLGIWTCVSDICNDSLFNCRVINVVVLQQEEKKIISNYSSYINVTTYWINDKLY